MADTPCVLDDCERRPTVGYGYCSRHYYRLRRWGDPHVVHTTHGRRRIPGDGIPCPHCDWRSSNEGSLRKHIYRVHEALCPIGCRFCDRRFLDKKARSVHEGRAHPEEFERKEDTLRGQREWNLRRKYGITIAEYDELLRAQGGCCAICPAAEAGDHNKRLHVDHCHETGAVRGLLCAACNHMLGKASDDPARLRAAAAYLEGC